MAFCHHTWSRAWYKKCLYRALQLYETDVRGDETDMRRPETNSQARRTRSCAQSARAGERERERERLKKLRGIRRRRACVRRERASAPSLNHDCVAVAVLRASTQCCTLARPKRQIACKVENSIANLITAGERVCQTCPRASNYHPDTNSNMGRTVCRPV